ISKTSESEKTIEKNSSAISVIKRKEAILDLIPLDVQISALESIKEKPYSLTHKRKLNNDQSEDFYSNEIDENKNLEFKRLYINIYNRKWAEFDIDLFLLGYFFHPYFWGKGFLPGVFHRVCHTAVSIWLKLDGEKYSSAQLLSQMTSYKQYEDPYNILFDFYNSSVQNWWSIIDQKNNHIQKLALKILAIMPH
ncbi:19986_t:CDS:2, partial [Dentiscutata erythropus]